MILYIYISLSILKDALFDNKFDVKQNIIYEAPIKC